MLQYDIAALELIECKDTKLLLNVGIISILDILVRHVIYLIANASKCCTLGITFSTCMPRKVGWQSDDFD